MPFFAAPLALFGLVALPALAGIYWLRNRYRRQTVSSLILWTDFTLPREGGTRVQRFRAPLLLFLELLAALLLAIAAAGPMMHSASGRRPLIVVLDDSFSMQAGTDTDSPRHLAMVALQKELSSGWYTARLLRAGATPQLIGEPLTAPAGPATLANWRCESPHADLQRAIAFATELGGEQTRILVLTDHAPDQPITPGRIQWLAFGAPRPNMAIVSASRSSGALPRCLFEVANFSDAPASNTLTIELPTRGGAPAIPPQRIPITVAAHHVQTVFADLKTDGAAVVGRLEPDALAADNSAMLLPEPQRIVRLAVDVQDANLRASVMRVIDGTPGTASSPPASADLLITDHRAAPGGPPERWTLTFTAEPDAAAYSGPFVVDRSHPLAQGIAMPGVIWAAGKTESLAGRPIVTAGNVVLIAESEAASGRHDVVMRIRRELSTLEQTPNWPILIWNLVQWRAVSLPGVVRCNVRVGQEIEINAPLGLEKVRITDPRSAERTLPVALRNVRCPADTPGIWQIAAGETTYSVAANLSDAGESDLSHRITGQYGDWFKAPMFQSEYGQIAWIFLLIAVSLLAAHMALISSSMRRGGDRV